MSQKMYVLELILDRVITYKQNIIHSGLQNSFFFHCNAEECSSGQHWELLVVLIYQDKGFLTLFLLEVTEGTEFVFEQYKAIWLFFSLFL